MGLKNKKVLLTYGPTSVPVDGVRVISNVSTGAMGRCLIEAFRKKQARLTVLEGLVQEPARFSGIKIKKFFFYDDLKKLIGRELKNHYDIFIHAAAVNDYRVKRICKGKIASGQHNLRLDLIPTPKLIHQIKKRAPDVLLVGFKLETNADPRYLSQRGFELIRKNRCDLAVANAVSGNGRYSGIIVDKYQHQLAKANSRALMAHRLIQTIENML